MQQKHGEEEQNGVQWREWSEAAFAEAREQDKPVLLDIGAVWCHWCHVMDDGIPGDPVHTGTYADPVVQARIAQSFIPIKVDNDRRPDINARYNMGGWPSTVFLTPDGDTLYGETYVAPSRMIGLLDYLSDLWHNNRAQIEEQTQQTRLQRREAESASTAADALDPATAETVLRHLKSQFDSVYGGFGSQPKFPHPAALLLALEHYTQGGDPALRTLVEATLDGMAGGGMYDRYAGGFFRYSTTRDWSVPHYEKMLEDNAKLTAVYAQASVLLDDPRWLAVTSSAQNWLLADMLDPDTGMFAGSQDADAEEHYYGEPLAIRATLPTPYIDRTLYAGWNALMVSALVERFQNTHEPDILAAAQRTWAFLADRMAQTDNARTLLSHYFLAGQPQGSAGLLADQTAFVQASLDLYAVTGTALYRDTALRAAQAVLDLEDTIHGGFFDLLASSDAIGELARPKKDLTENAEAALALLRLSALTDNSRYRQAAERALRLFANEYRGFGYHAAAYARAVDAALAPPLHIVLVGSSDHPDLLAFQQAAWRLPLPAKAIERLPDGTANGFPATADGAPRAYVCVGTQCTQIDDAGALTWEGLRHAIKDGNG